MVTWMMMSVALAAVPGPMEERAPAEVVRALNGTLLSVMKEADDLGYSGRFERVAPAVDAAFDVPFMAEKSLGRHWKGLDDDDRSEWVTTFREFMVANYAGRFDAYGGQSFEQRGEEAAPHDTVVVHTELMDPGRENVTLNYRLHETPDGWKIVDVYLKGTVSELALRRSDYSAVMKRDGFAALETYLKEKIAALEAGKAD